MISGRRSLIAPLTRRGWIASALCLTLGLVGFNFAALAQTYPDRVVRIVVPFTPGGVADSGARVVADRLAARWGKPVVVENRPGAGGNLGTQQVAAAPPDGYTLLLGFDGTMVINPFVYEGLRFDTLKDFVPVTKIGDATLILVAHPSVQANNLRELIAQAKDKPEPLSYGTAGIGSTPHLAGELLSQQTGLPLSHVPYKGGGQSMDHPPTPAAGTDGKRWAGWPCDWRARASRPLGSCPACRAGRSTDALPRPSAGPSWGSRYRQ
jgi:tripartite-type tricarboxylate transporter receptor subunit TctC